MKPYVNRLHTNKDITNTCTIIKQYVILLSKHLTFILLIQYNIHFLIITNPFKSSLQRKEKKRKQLVYSIVQAKNNRTSKFRY